MYSDYFIIQEQALRGRYVNFEQIVPLINSLIDSEFNVSTEGYSVNGIPIYSIGVGSGNKKVLMWSQMHGNESTTTKAIFDFINLLKTKHENIYSSHLLENFTFKIIPMLNPDGAELYKRENANKVDLNRDAQHQTQSEIKTFFKVFDEFKPDVCLNLHDQRTIFSAGKTGKSAIISFLAPSIDEDKTQTPPRMYAMQLIAYMANCLNKQINGHIGRYDDGFNLNCIGDTLQSKGIPTILFEAGHFPGDYEREKTREIIFNSFLFLFDGLLNKKLPGVSSYFLLPENQKLFFDVLIKNVKIPYKSELTDVAIQFEEQLKQKKINLIPKIVRIDNLKGYFGHKMIEARGEEILVNNSNHLKIDMVIDKILVGGQKVSL